MKKLEKEPFALLGINSDGGREPLQKIMKEQEVTWRQAVDGDTSGPIAKKWNVQGWPTIYVLDAKGVIRYRDLRDEELEEAVVALIDEAKGKKRQGIEPPGGNNSHTFPEDDPLWQTSTYSKR